MNMPISGFNPASFAASIGDVDDAKKSDNTGEVKDPNTQVPAAGKDAEKETPNVAPGKYTDAVTQYAALNDFVSATGKLLAMINEMATKDRQMNKEIVRQQYENIQNEAMSAADKMREGAVTSLVMGLVGGVLQIASGTFSVVSGSMNLKAEIKAQGIQGAPADKLNTAQTKVDNLENSNKLGDMNKDLKQVGNKIADTEKLRDTAQQNLDKAQEKLANLEKVPNPTTQQKAEIASLKTEINSLKTDIDTHNTDLGKLNAEFDSKSADIAKFKAESKEYQLADQELKDAKATYNSAHARAETLTALNRSRGMLSDGVNQVGSAISNITRTISEYKEANLRADVKESEAKEAHMRAAIEGLKEVNDSLKELSSKARETVQELSRSETDTLRKILTV